MRQHGRRFWFDSDGQMATKFGVEALPSVVTRADPLMRVERVFGSDAPYSSVSLVLSAED